MDQQNVVCPHKGILFSLEEEGHSDTCYATAWVNLEDIMLGEVRQSAERQML